MSSPANKFQPRKLLTKSQIEKIDILIINTKNDILKRRLELARLEGSLNTLEYLKTLSDGS